MASLREYGFAAVVDHPLDDDRVARIYGEWLAFFSSGEASGFRMDPVKQDGYFSLEEAEHAKGFVERDFKNTSSSIPGVVAPSRCKRIWRAILLRPSIWVQSYSTALPEVCPKPLPRSSQSRCET